MIRTLTTLIILFCCSFAMAQTQPIRNPAISGTGSIIVGATLSNNGTLNGSGAFDISGGTVTLPATVGGLASWLGTTGITTLGTITTGTWNGSVIGSTYGGSGQTSLTNSIQAYLDAISTTQGTILYYNGTDWVALSPGTSGQFLKTLGAGANPAWAAGGSGAVATDAIFDAAGDLAIGTGADTAARLAIGTSGQVLTSNGTTATWATLGGTLSGLTATRVPFASGAAALTDSANLTFVTDTLSGTALKINVTATTAATNSSDGALIVAGGAGIAKDSWINSVRVGTGAGNVVTNTIVGSGALEGGVSASHTTAVGYQAAYATATVGGTTALGYRALFASTAGENTAVGDSALGGMTAGANNTAIGSNAGVAKVGGGLVTGLDNSVIIGKDAAPLNDTGDTNEIVIGYASPGGGSNTTTIGNSSTTAFHPFGELRLGTAGSLVGTIAIRNATSGTITVTPPTGALGTPTITWPTTTGTLAILGENTFTGAQTITVTGTQNAINASTSLAAATGNETAYTLAYTTNKATSGNDTGLKIAMTDTASPGTSKPLSIETGATEVFAVNSAGQLVFGSGSSPLQLDGLYADLNLVQFGSGELSSNLPWSATQIGWRTGANYAFIDCVGVGILEQKFSTTAQTFRIYGTTTGSKYLSLSHDGTNGVISASSGLISLDDNVALKSVTAPASATDTGTAGEIRWDADYIYICTATNIWKRVAIATW